MNIFTYIVLFCAGGMLIRWRFRNRNGHMENDRRIDVGGLYVTKSDKGGYSVMKVLAVDSYAVHLRSYANHFDDFPADLDPSDLTIGSITDGSFGIGHFPLAKDGFWADDPVLVKSTVVADEELDGYRVYLEAMS